MSSLLSIVFVLGVTLLLSSAINGESHICGYSGYSFLCCSGYKKDNQGECSLPICENDCGRGGHCIRPDTCLCPDGRVSTSCSEEGRQDNDGGLRKKETTDMCLDNCNGQGVCVNGKCQCRTGYAGESCIEKLDDVCYLSLSRGICQKSQIEIRLNIELCCSAFDVAWGDRCQKCPRSRCEKGFMEIDGICRDVNECSIPELCQNGRCENFEGSYKCLCTTGYQFDPIKGDCVKTKDPCKQYPSVCGSGMKCVSLSMERYSCRCLQGYTESKDRKSCVPKEYRSFDYCEAYGAYVCQSGRCRTDGNNYKCDCNPGYKSSGDGKSCKKSIDYCALYQNALCQSGTCVSVGDDFMCKCNPGYTPSFNRKKCTSVCDLYPGSLCPNARCIPQTDGSYECQCNDGYSAIGKGKQCRRIMNDDQSGSSSNAGSTNDSPTSYDVDYCSYDYYTKQCQGGRCVNRKGYYQCECLNGYITDKNGLACKKLDIPAPDQMLDMAGPVDFKSYCDKYGSFLCQNGHCVESGSSYQCRCNSGYKESSNGKHCYDIDECSSEPDVCVQGTCTNSPGNYQCSCYDGFTIHYVPGGPKCYDRNECEEDPMLCANGQCVNTWGSYHCSCNDGYIVSNDEKQCVRVRSKSAKEISFNDIQCRNCASDCIRVNGSYYKCECIKGTKPVLNSGLCAPITQVIDIQFDIPQFTSRRRKRSNLAPKHIFFELTPTADKNTFIKKVSSKDKNVILQKCMVEKKSDREGVICFFGSSTSNENH